MSTEEFPDVHAAYMKYVEQLSIEPTNPTQLIKFAKQESIQGLTWSKCSKYFKILHGQSTTIHKAEPPPNWNKNRRYSNETKPKKQHHKTTSGPILNIKQAMINNTHTNNIKTHTNNNKTQSNNESNHRRANSAIDAETHKENVVKNENKKIAPFHTVKVDKFLVDLKESEIESIDTDDVSDSKQINEMNGNLKTENTEKNETNGQQQTPNNIKPRESSTPSTSFKSIKIEPKSVQKPVQKPKKKHILLDKPWNKHKSSTWPKNRMSMSYDLKQWLIDNKFEKFSTQLYHYGIESMNDLKLLTTENMIEDLCGKNNIKMTIIYRRKFIKKVMEVNNGINNGINNNIKNNNIGMFFGSLVQSIDENKEMDNKNINKQQFKYEMQAVDALTKRIKQTANNIKITKQFQNDIVTNTKMIKENVSKDFDELIKQIALRKKQILQTIDKKNKIIMDRLNEQHNNICDTAKILIYAQQGAIKQIRDNKSNDSNESNEQKQNDIINLIESSFEQTNKYTNHQYSFVTKAQFKYNNGDITHIKNYGKLIFNDEQLV